MKMHFFLLMIPVVLFLSGISCKSGGYILPYTVDRAIVIGTERCFLDESKNYWLLNFNGNYGDTLTYNGTLYHHVVKTDQLHILLKKTGMRVFLSFDMSSNKMSSTQCDVVPAKNYFLRTLKLHTQSELK